MQHSYLPVSRLCIFLHSKRRKRKHTNKQRKRKRHYYCIHTPPRRLYNTSFSWSLVPYVVTHPAGSISFRFLTEQLPEKSCDYLQMSYAILQALLIQPSVTRHALYPTYFSIIQARMQPSSRHSRQYNYTTSFCYLPTTHRIEVYTTCNYGRE